MAETAESRERRLKPLREKPEYIEPEVIEVKPSDIQTSIRDINLAKWNAVVELMSDPTVRMTKKEIARVVGISYQQLMTWLKMPQFRRALHIRTIEKLEENVPKVMQALLKKAVNGHIKAIELFLKVTGAMIQDNIMTQSKFANMDDLEFKQLLIDVAEKIKIDTKKELNKFKQSIKDEISKS